MSSEFVKLQERHELLYLNVKALLTLLLQDIPAVKLGQYVQHVALTPIERLNQEALVRTWGGILEPFVREMALTLSGQVDSTPITPPEKSGK